MPVLFLFFSLLQCNLEYRFLHFTCIARPDTGLVCLSRKEYRPVLLRVDPAKIALPAFQNRISALGSYSVSGVRSGCSVTQICSSSLQNTLNIRISFMCLKTTVSIGLCLILLDADVDPLPIDHIFSAGQSRQFPGVYIFAYLLYALCRYSDLGILRQSVHISFDHCVSFRWYYLYMGPYAAQAR